MNIRKRFKSIHYKTLLYLIVFAIVILLLLWGTQVYFTSYLYEKYQVKDIKKIADDIQSVDVAILDNYLSDVVYNNSVCIEYVDMFGRSYLYNDNLTGCLLGKGNRYLESYMISLQERDEASSAIKLVNPDYDSSALLYGVRVNGGYIYLFTMLRNVSKNDRLIKGQLIYVTLVIILLSIFISLFLATVISKPIVNITEKAKELAKGNYKVKFDKNGIQEIDDLADTLNYLEHEVSKTDEYRRDLMANVSHDLKTPLTMIKAYAEMVRDLSYKDKEKREEHLNVIIEETDRLNVLVSDILALSKLQANADVLELECFDLREEVEAIIKRYGILKETDNYQIILEAPDKVLVNADKKKINQVIYNLVNNAINYTGDDHKVWVKIKEEKKDFLIEIKDSGKGINKKELEHIWDKYYKNEKNHKRNKIGTGIGLSIVKNILEEHHFKYGVLSKKNSGTIFYFRINKGKDKK